MSSTLLRGAQVITMAPNRPDVECVDILIEDDRIVETAEHVDSTGADLVDFSGRIIIPGLINAHLHSWQTGLRFVGADWTFLQYLTRIHGGMVRQYRPDDMNIGTLVGALTQINCGTTTIGDWCHNCLTPEHADAAIDGLGRSGIRAVFLHGTPYGVPDIAHPVHEIDRLDGVIRTHALITLGMAVKGPQFSTLEVAVADFRAAAERGLVVSMHQSGGTPAPAWAAVRAAGLLGRRVNIAHGAGMTDEWVKSLVDEGVSFTITPENELSHGHGPPITGRLLRYGSAPSLGTDTETAVSGEILTAARIALAYQRGLDHEQARESTGMCRPSASITSKQALSWATTEGARALGLENRVGRLEPGMQADLVAIDARALNLWQAHDPMAAALHANAANIEAVMIAGQWRKRDHQFVGVDLTSVENELRESGNRLLACATAGAES